MRLDTANGIVERKSWATVWVDEIQEKVEALVMPNSPAVLSLGLRCEEKGWAFLWKPFSHEPLFISPDGHRYKCRTSHNVPYIVSKDCPQSYDRTCPWCSSNIKGKYARPSAAAPASDAHAEEAELTLERDEDGIDAVADEVCNSMQLSGKELARHALTHLPALPHCEVCRQAKMRQKVKRIKRRMGPAPKKFGDQITADHLIAHSERSQGFCGESAALVMRDRATNYVGSYGLDGKFAIDTLQAFQQWLGASRPKFVWTDNSKELIWACAQLKTSHGTSTQGLPQSNGIAEGTVKLVSEGTRCSLLGAGLPQCAWPLAMSHFVHAYNCDTRKGFIPWVERHGVEFDGKLIPFGARVHYLLSPADTKALPRMGSRGVPGIFLG